MDITIAVAVHTNLLIILMLSSRCYGQSGGSGGSGESVAPYNATITEAVNNNNVTFTCYADGGLGNTYEWLRIGDNEVVSVTQELILDNTDPLDGGVYQCTITNIAGNTSAMRTRNVATVIVTSPQTQNVTARQSFMITCNATGYPVPSIEWRLNGTSYIIRDSSITTITLTEGLRSNTSNITVTNATTNDTGIYECVATNVVNTDTQDSNVTIQNCPDEPINVQIFNVNSRTLTINWTEPHNNNDLITNYNISYQNPDCLVNANNVTRDMTVTSMEEQVVISNLHPGEVYTFTIIAINNICPSQPSVPASVRTMEEVPGAAPVVSTIPDQRSINVSWMMLECQDCHGNITMYEVRYTGLNFGENVNQTLNTSSGDKTSLGVDGLEEFANYTIEVRAYTAIGPGPYSSPMDVRTLPDIPSASVTNLNVRETQPTSVELSWGPVNERDQNGIILSYGIYYRLNDSSDPYRMINVTERSRIISGLMENEVYVFAVTAFNQVGESMVNVSIMARTNGSPTSTLPRNVMISNVTDDDDIAILITWDPPSDPNGIIRYYRIEFQQISDPLDNNGKRKRNAALDDTVMNAFTNITSGSSGAPTTITLSGLIAYRVYNYSIFAATSVGEGPSADGSFLTREDTPFAPENLTVSIPGVARNSTTLLVNWERPLCDRGILSGYELCYVESSVDDCDNNGMTVNITGANQSSYTINDLSINTNYIVEVRGRTGAGLGDPASANGTVDEDAPDPVMNIVAQFSPNNTTRGIYNITWTSPAATNGSFYQMLQYSYSSAYTIGPTYNDSFNTTYLELNQSQNQFIFDAFYYTNYNFTITTFNIKYNITNGPTQSSNQSSPTVPTAVRDIKVMMSTPESIYITWDHPEYPNSQLLNYIVYYNDNPEMLQSSGNISANGFENEDAGITTSYNLTGLVPFTNYSLLVTVSGRDVVDNAPFGMEILQRTNATVPTVLPTIQPTTTPPTTTQNPFIVTLPSPEQIETGIVEVYAVIVVTGNLLRINDNSRRRRRNDNALRSPREIIRDLGDVLPDPYDPINPMDIYTAAVWNRAEDVPAMFILGSGSRTTGPDGTVYENTALAESTEYGVFNYIRLESDNENPGPLLVADTYLRVVVTGITPQEDSNAGAIAAGVIIPLIIIPLIIIAAIIVAIIVFVWYYRHRHYTKKKFYIGNVAKMHADSTVIVIPNLERSFTQLSEAMELQQNWWEKLTTCLIDYNTLEIEKTIAKGNFGVVYKGYCTGEGEKVEVAIKTIKDVSLFNAKEFIDECIIANKFAHPNVLSIVGVSIIPEDNIPLMIMPFMDNGSVQSYVKSKRGNSVKFTSFPKGLSHQMLMQMCLDIAKGMEYLSLRYFVHRDLAARNCMLNKKMTVKVGDFGLARDIYTDSYYTSTNKRKPLPVKWLAPEALLDRKFTEKTDVWAFGITCWEIFSLGLHPYPSISASEISNHIQNGGVPDRPYLSSDEMYKIMRSCWIFLPEERPSFTALVQNINQHLNTQQLDDHSEDLYLKIQNS